MKCTVLASLVSFALGTAAHAQTNPYQLVGFTSATFTGDTGVLGFTQSCQAQFGAAARMCTSLEVSQTVVVPSGLSGDAWVLPRADVASATENESCNGWSAQSGAQGSITGLAVDASGGFPGGRCDIARSVSCCAPVPLPEPTSSLMQGTGALVVGMLAKGKMR